MSFPAVETIVEVIAPGGFGLTAEVMAATEAGVTIEWGGDAPPSGQGEVRWPGPNGLHVLPCVITGDGRYGRLEGTSEPAVIQRRDAVRVELRVPVARLDGQHFEGGQTLNISAKGLRFAGLMMLRVDDVALLSIELPDCPADPLKVRGRVRHVDENERMGIEFLDLSVQQQERIMHVVFEQQRVALRRRHEQKTHLRLVKGDG